MIIRDDSPIVNFIVVNIYNSTINPTWIHNLTVFANCCFSTNKLWLMFGALHVDHAWRAGIDLPAWSMFMVLKTVSYSDR